MPKAVASDIYRRHHSQPIRYNDLSAGFDYSALDEEINSGFVRVLPWSSKALGKSVASIGDLVIAANASGDKVSLIQSFWGVRLAFLQGLHTWSHFGKGWGRRCAQGEAAAVRMWLSIGAALSPADVVQLVSVPDLAGASKPELVDGLDETPTKDIGLAIWRH